MPAAAAANGGPAGRSRFNFTRCGVCRTEARGVSTRQAEQPDVRFPERRSLALRPRGRRGGFDRRRAEESFACGCFFRLPRPGETLLFPAPDRAVGSRCGLFNGGDGALVAFAFVFSFARSTRKKKAHLKKKKKISKQAYGGQGAGVARALVQAPAVVAAAVQRATSSSSSAPPSSRLFGASSAALVALALSGAVASASRDATSALFLRVAASGALFASVAAAVLSDATSRGRSGASTFVKLKQGAVAGSAAAVGAVVGGAAASSAAAASFSALLPAVGVSAALLLFGGTSAWELATVKK